MGPWGQDMWQKSRTTSKAFFLNLNMIDKLGTTSKAFFLNLNMIDKLGHFTH